MKRMAFAVAVLAGTLPLYARHSHQWRQAIGEPVLLKVVELPDGAAVAARLIEQVRAGSAAQIRGGVGTSAIMNNSSTRSVVIPAAGSVRGGGGTFFRSDITLANWNVTAQDVAVVWMPNGGASTTFRTTFPGDRPPFTVQDFVGTLLNRDGLGSLFFIPITSAGAVDPNGAIDAYSRIWTPQPNATGTVSQPFSGVDPNHLRGEYEAFVLGLRQDSAYRTNFGIVNLHNTQLNFLVTVFPESSSAGTQLTEVHVTIPAMSMIQQALPAGAYTTPINLLVEVDENVPGSNQVWTAYASSTDNITGDGWVSIAGKDWDDESLDSLTQPSRPRKNH